MHLDFLATLLVGPDRIWVGAAAMCFILAFVYSGFALASGWPLAARNTLILIGLGFVALTIFLFVRGHAIGRCPITNYFELLVFMAWSMVLIYFAIGSTYRMSLLGAFTAPVASIILVSALSLPDRSTVPVKTAVDPWLEAHTSFSIVACGAFALACVAGGMYLFQERQLKTLKPGSIFFRLPPITALTIANSRLLWVGFALLSVGLSTGFFVKAEVDWRKVAWSIIVWSIYGGILFARLRRRMAARWIATFSIIAFSLLLGIFWGIRFVSESSSVQG